jgi:hypothetical protein
MEAEIIIALFFLNHKSFFQNPKFRREELTHKRASDRKVENFP